MGGQREQLEMAVPDLGVDEAIIARWLGKLAVHRSDGTDLFVVHRVRNVVGAIHEALTGRLHQPE